MPLLSSLTIAPCKEEALAARPQETILHGHNSSQVKITKSTGKDKFLGPQNI